MYNLEDFFWNILFSIHHAREMLQNTHPATEILFKQGSSNKNGYE